MIRSPSVAKVTPPRAADIPPRIRLHRRLDDLRRCHSVPWIVAPAGSGKTVLVAGYVQRRRIPAIWYRVDESDQLAEDLFYYLRLALEAFVGSKRAGADLPSHSAAADLARFSRRFFDALFARLPARAIVVFDDFHSAPENSEWQFAVQKGLECVPPGKNIVAVSRSAPPSAFARSRVVGDLGLLGTPELLLSEDETLASAARSRSQMKARTRDEILAIHAATGGWPAGVSLLLAQDGVASVPRLAFDSALQPIFDYLEGAVFSKFRPDERRLLLCTAHLRSFTPEVAEAIAGVPGARSALAELHRSNFLLQRDDTDAETFRYHDLFRSFLVRQASRSLPAHEVQSIRSKTAKLLREEGRDGEALELFLQSKEFLAMRDLVLDSAPTLFARGRIALLERWIAMLPEPLVEGQAWLEYWRSLCLLTAAPDASRRGFERALDIFERDRDWTGAYLAWAGAVQAVTYEGRGYGLVEKWLERLERMEQACPAIASADVGSQVAGSVVMALTLSGSDDQTVELWQNRAYALAERAGAPSVRAMTASMLLLHHALRGDAGRAAPWLARLEGAADESSAGLLASVAAWGAKAALAWHQGDVESTLAAARTGLDLIGDRRFRFWQLAVLVCGSCAALELGELRLLDEFVDRLADIADSGPPIEVSAYHYVRSQRALARGDAGGAIEAIELSLDRDRAVGFPYGQGRDLHTLAYAAFEAGDPERGHEALGAARRIEEQYREPALPYWRLLIEADVALRSGDRGRAVERLRGAFATGKERQLYGGVFPHGQRLADLCRLALEERIEPEYARTLIRRRRLRASPPPFEVEDWPWPVRIYTFGRVEIGVGEAPPRALRARTQGLLLRAAALLGAGGRPVPSARIVSMVWPEADGDAGMRAFGVTLVRLRKQLGPDGHGALRLEGGSLRLDPSVCWSDVAAIDPLLKHVATLERGGAMPSGALRSAVNRLLALCRSASAADDELPPALFALENRLRARIASAVCVLCRILERSGDSALAESTYLQALEAEVSPAALLAPALRCLVRRGRVREARALYETYRHQGVGCEEADAVFAASRDVRA